MATSGENYWPPTGRTSWPLTRRYSFRADQLVSSYGTLVNARRHVPSMNWLFTTHVTGSPSGMFHR